MYECKQRRIEVYEGICTSMKVNKGLMMEVYEGKQRCNDGGV